MNRIAGNTTSANALALSQETLRSLSCHGQINRKSPPRSNQFLPAASSRAVLQSLWQAGGAIPMGVDGLQQMVVSPRLDAKASPHCFCSAVIGIGDAPTSRSARDVRSLRI